MPPRAARVPRIAVATAPLPGGGFEPTTFAAARLAGASEFYVGNGVGMIAALCFGTASIAPVDGIFGPGPAAMLAAMGLAGAFGVRTALGIGPTDCMILADGSADPVAVALDLMTEAEHGPDSAAVLVTPSEALARAVSGALAARLPAVEPARRAVLEHSFGPAGLSALALVPDWRAACGLAQSFAPEHLMLVGDEAEALAGELSCAGEVLRGPATPFAAANYCDWRHRRPADERLRASFLGRNREGYVANDDHRLPGRERPRSSRADGYRSRGNRGPAVSRCGVDGDGPNTST